MRALARLLRRASEPAIVFTEYRDTLERVATVLDSLRPVLLHGGLTPSERRESLRQFTSGAAQVLLATDAASEGLNLHERCRLVINLELPWTPLRLEQRVGRVERIGQTRRVHALHLLAAGTAEESNVARLLRRTDRASEATEKLRARLPALAAIRATAEAETQRIGKMRLLAKSPHIIITDARPPLSVRRKQRGVSASLWGFHLSFADSSEQRVWHTLLGASGWSTDSSVPSHSIFENERERILASLVSSLQAFLDCATRRERALARAIESERARLSATLLQHGLFDRRAERALSAQTAVLDEALARCRARLHEIESTGQIVAEPARLAFALLRR